MTPRRMLLASLVALGYAACYSVIKLGLAQAAPFAFAGLRALIAGAALFGASAVVHGGILPPRRLLPWLPALGLLLSAEYAAMFVSPALAGAGLSSVLGNTGPVLLVILAAVVLRERITRATAGALVLGALAIVIIAWPGAAGTGRGPWLPLLAAFAGATQTVVFKRLEVGSALLPVVSWQLILGALPLMVASTWLDPRPAIVWTAGFGWAVGFVAVVGTALTLVVWYWLVQREPVTRLAPFLFLVPVGGLAMAWSLFREPLSARELVGAALALGAVGQLYLFPRTWSRGEVRLERMQ